MRVWRGQALLEHPRWPLQLSRAEAAALEQFTVASEGRDAEEIDRDEARIPALSELAGRLADELENGTGVVLLRGLPLDRWNRSAADRAFWALTLQLGVPVSQSAEGQRLFRVRDAGYKPGDPRFRGPMSRKRLSFHTDRCDAIAFLCLQPAARGGETFVVSSAAIRDELERRDPAALETLRQPFPYLRHTVDLGNARPYCELPVFSEQDGYFAAHFLRVLIDRADQSDDAPNLTDEQRRALDVLETLAEDPKMHVSFHLQRGDALLLNNWTTLHRRSEFVDAEEPERKRELLRVWLSMDNSRPIDPRFVDHFGAIDPGALRGGMRPLSG